MNKQTGPVPQKKKHQKHTNECVEKISKEYPLHTVAGKFLVSCIYVNIHEYQQNTCTNVCIYIYREIPQKSTN